MAASVDNLCGNIQVTGEHKQQNQSQLQTSFSLSLKFISISFI